MMQFTVAVVQLDSGEEKAANVESMLAFVEEAADRDADLVAFPEMATYMGEGSRYSAVAESVPGPTTDALAEKAREHGLYVHIGSLFESIPDSDRVHNTSGVIDPDGELLGTYRKLHLFDVDGTVTHRESDRVAPGDGVTTVDTDLGTFGLSVCYDLRFPRLYRALAARGADVLFVPSAFALHTGRDHWEALLKARAIENQAYVVAPGQIGDNPDSIRTYGRSLVVDPWGVVTATASDREELFTATIDLGYLESVRGELRTLEHVRSDLEE